MCPAKQGGKKDKKKRGEKKPSSLQKGEEEAGITIFPRKGSKRKEKVTPNKRCAQKGVDNSLPAIAGAKKKAKRGGESLFPWKTAEISTVGEEKKKKRLKGRGNNPPISCTKERNRPRSSDCGAGKGGKPEMNGPSSLGWHDERGKRLLLVAIREKKKTIKRGKKNICKIAAAPAL